jgi:hypothetical protein
MHRKGETMKRWGLRRLWLELLVAGLLCAAVPVSLRADGPEGTWKLRMTSGGRPGRLSILKLQMEDEQLTGILLDYQGSESAIENVKYEDGMLSFEVPSVWRGQAFKSSYVGTLAEDTITGTALGDRRGRTTKVEWVATRTSQEEVSRIIELPPVAADIGLNEGNYSVWRDHILPSASEMSWEQIPWLTTFKDGILAADAAGKPLLLWTMNGHPLGCT